MDGKEVTALKEQLDEIIEENAQDRLINFFVRISKDVDMLIEKVERLESKVN